MEDEAQKMVALKKAYADIILNTAKEAAARIMVSERKALRFQQDLSASRDEALRMLLRLKQMLDSKTTESELKSSSQQRRIDELEAQLQEAEDVITDLRAELKSTEDELQSMKRNQVHNRNEFTEKFAPFVSPGCQTMATSDIKNSSMNPRVTDDKCSSTVKQTEKLTSSGLSRFDHPGKTDLASIIMRSKKPELYRNGCTQRIRAFERDSLNGKLPPEEYEDVEIFPVENNDYVTGASKIETCGFSLKSAIIEMDKNLSQGERKKPGKVCTFRRRKTRFGKAKILRRCHASSSSYLYCKPSSVKGRDSFNEEGERASDRMQENSQHEDGEEFKVINKGKRKRNVKSGNDDGSKTSPSGQLSKHSKPSPVLSRCRTFAYLVDGGIKSIEDQSKTCENEAKVKPLTRLDPGLTLIKRGPDSVPVSADFQALNKPEPIQNDAEISVESVDDSRRLCSEIDSEVINVSLPKCGVENVKACESKSENNRLLKYTFQRKRKKEAISGPDESASPEKISVMKKTSEEFTAPESEKSGMAVESSRDSRRLAQVARQLISLSGKRWQ